MKKTMMFVFLLFLFPNIFGQIVNYKSSTIREFGITKIIRWEIKVESQDSAMTVCFFDTLGYKTVEKSQFSKDGRYYDSVRYEYNDKGYLVNEEYYSPYVFQSFSVIPAADSLEIVYYEQHRIKSVVKWWKGGDYVTYDYNYATFLKNVKGELIYVKDCASLYTDFEYSFNPDCRYYASVKDKYGNEFCVISTDLVDFISIKKHGVLTDIEKYEYFFRK